MILGEHFGVAMAQSLVVGYYSQVFYKRNINQHYDITLWMKKQVPFTTQE
jgi:hypothetical protein